MTAWHGFIDVMPDSEISLPLGGINDPFSIIWNEPDDIGVKPHINVDKVIHGKLQVEKGYYLSCEGQLVK